MSRVVSTRIFSSGRLTASRLDQLSRAGFDGVEILADRRYFDYRNAGQIDELRNWFADSTLKLASLRAPEHSDVSGGRGGPQALIRITNLDKAERIRATDELKRVIDVADRLQFDRLIVPFGSAEEDYDPHKIDAAFNALDELLVFSRGLDVEILLANQPSEMGQASKLKLFLSMTHLPFGYCFDAAAAALSGESQEQFETMQDRVRGLAAADAATDSTERLAPFLTEQGMLDWHSLGEQVRECAPIPNIVLDIDDPGTEQPLADAHESLERLEEILYG